MSSSTFGSSSSTLVSDRHDDQRIGAADSSIVFSPRFEAGKKSQIKYTTNSTTNTTYVDPGAIELVGKLITAQSGITSGALDFATAAQEKNALLAQTKVTDGANLNQKTTIVALAVLGALAAVFLLLKRH